MLRDKILRKILAISLAAAWLGGNVTALNVSAYISHSKDITNHSVGVTGSFNSWNSDISLTDSDGDGIYEGIVEIEKVTDDMITNWYIDDKTTGESYLQFKVRLDSDWEDTWGYYEPLNDCTYNSHSNVPVKEAVVGQPIKFKVFFDINNPDPQALANPDSYADANNDDYMYLHTWYEIIERKPEDDLHKSGKYRYMTLDDGTVELCDTTGAGLNYHITEIPETIDGKAVSSVNGTLHNADNRGRFFLPKTITNLNKEKTYFECNNSIVGGEKFVVYGNPVLADLLKGSNLIFVPMPNNIVKSGNYTYYENGDGTINIFTYEGDEKDIVVPAEIDGKKVFEIDDCAFFGLQSTETVKIPGSIEYIGSYAFAYSGYPKGTVIKKVEMEEGLKDIGMSAFFVSSNWRNSTTGAFEEMTIPKSTSVSASSFDRNSWLKNKTDEFVIVGDNALIKYNGTDKKVVIPNGVKYITNAFYESGHHWYGSSSPYNESIPDIEEVVIPNTVEYIWGNAFAELKNLKEITIPDSVREIGGYSFAYCTSLEKIVIPASVTSMPWDDTFYGCDLEKLKIYGTKGSLAEKYANEHNIQFVSIDGYANISTVSANEITLGQTVTVNAKAVQGTGDCTYAVQYKKKYDTKWTTKQNYSTNDTITIKPEKATYYEICVKTKDSTGKILKKFFEIKVNTKLANTSTISATTIDEGTSIIVRGSATGGIGGYKYAVLYKKKADTKWTTKQNYSVNDTPIIKPAKATDYDICVKIQDEAGNIVKKFFEVKVNAKLKNTSTISAATIGQGETVTVKASATGGKGGYKYAALYKKKADAKWTVKQNYSTNADITIKPAKATDYDVCIKVQDEMGTIIKKFFSVTVEDRSLKNTSTISATTIKQGENFTLKASAKDGKGNYTYAALYKKKSDTKWTVKQNYSTKNTIKITPNDVSDYDVCVKVKDGEGTIVKQFFTVTVKEPDYKTEANSDGTITITKYKYPKNRGDVVIPETIGGKKVTAIGSKAFYRCTGLTSVTIPDSVTSIGSYAFSSCTGLTSVNIGNSVTSIGSFAFSSCTGLTSINVSESNTAYSTDKGVVLNKNKTKIIYCPKGKKGEYSIPDSVTSIGDSAFSSCTSLTSINIPDSVTSIGNYAFSSCTSLTSINIPDSVTSIGNYAFSSCTGLTSINIPDSVTSIGNSAFSSCTGLTSVNIGNSVTSIGSETFYSCTGLTSVNIGNSVTSIGYYAFSSCTGLTSVNIGNSVTLIDWFAFYGCTGLTSITIPDSVTSIGDYAFRDCTGLTSVNIGNSVTSIDWFAFYGCTGLTSINVSESNTAYSTDKGVVLNKNKTKIIYCPKGKKGEYSIPDSVTSIDNYAFSDCTSLTSINVSENNTTYSSDDGVVLNKDKTEVIYCPRGRKGEYSIPDSVTYIGESAFSNCTGLTSITIPDSVIAIDGFWKCTGLTNITIPDSVTSINTQAFYGCTGLTSITIPDSVTSISYDAFSGCTGLTSINIPDSVTSISESAFGGCTGLTSINIPDSVTSIGRSAFYNCTGLTNITIPDSVTSISEGAFSGCTGLTSINIPDSVTYIGWYAFFGCTGLTSINIPDSVTSIGGYAFKSCTGLTIYGTEGSYAETYAKNNNIPFVAC